MSRLELFLSSEL
uniref:Uncharacterized protein n=1 Tax=Arundo donax TaxID=35708 RepID=A0A0A8Z7P9_ARUDO